MKIVFISSTYQDLKEYRNKVQELLFQFDGVTIKGMENFGARSSTPLDTCYAEIESCDIYIGIIAYRLGSVHSSGKSFTQLEYEKAVEKGKEIFIYEMSDEHPTPPKFVDKTEDKAIKLSEFKKILRERHTIVSFSSEEDLIEKMSKDLSRNGLIKKGEKVSQNKKDEYQETEALLKKMFLLPKVYSNKEIKLEIKITGEPFPVSQELCNKINFLEYGKTIGIPIEIIQPAKLTENNTFKYLFIGHKEVDGVLENLSSGKLLQIYATAYFSEKKIERFKANFLDSYVYSFPATSVGYLSPNLMSAFNLTSVEQNGIKKELIVGDGTFILVLRAILT